MIAQGFILNDCVAGFIRQDSTEFRIMITNAGGRIEQSESPGLVITDSVQAVLSSMRRLMDEGFIDDPKTQAKFLTWGVKGMTSAEEIVQKLVSAGITITEEIEVTVFDLPSPAELFGIPKNKNFPEDAVQCGKCGGHGCQTCEDNGWLANGHQEGRHCAREACFRTIPPAHMAEYCSNECAWKDA